MSDLWLVEYELTMEEFDEGRAGKLTTAKRLRKLGMDWEQIRETFAAYDRAKRLIESDHSVHL